MTDRLTAFTSLPVSKVRTNSFNNNFYAPIYSSSIILTACFLSQLVKAKGNLILMQR